jgi:hypothetical protein
MEKHLAVFPRKTSKAGSTRLNLFLLLYAVVPERKGRLEARRIPDIESLVDAINRVHHFVILLLHSWSTPRITAGQL